MLTSWQGTAKLGDEKKAGRGKRKRVEFWLESAEDDWRAAKHLFQKGDYSHSLFFGHLTVEKTLKAIYVYRLNDNPPFTHRLAYLAEKASLELPQEKLELLETVTDFNLEARYPDEKFSFRKKCTKEFTRKYLDAIGVMKKWLANQIKQSGL